MQRDIRKLFDHDELEDKKLPKDHEIEFIKKLRKNKSRKNFNSLFFKVAASFLLIMSVGYYLLNLKTTPLPDTETALELQVKQIEKQYLKQIDIEWQNFIDATNDQRLIKTYEEKIENLDSNYKELTYSFKENPNDIYIIEDLINNLQNRLQLLKDIQNHIYTLNEKNKTYETLIL